MIEITLNGLCLEYDFRALLLTGEGAPEVAARSKWALAAQGERHRIVHFHDLVGMHELDRPRDGSGQRRLQFGLAPDQKQRCIGLMLKELQCGGNGDRDTVVTAHAIDGESNRHRSLASAARSGHRRSAMACGDGTWGSTTGPYWRKP